MSARLIHDGFSMIESPKLDERDAAGGSVSHFQSVECPVCNRRQQDALSAGTSVGEVNWRELDYERAKTIHPGQRIVIAQGNVYAKAKAMQGEEVKLSVAAPAFCQDASQPLLRVEIEGAKLRDLCAPELARGS